MRSIKLFLAIVLPMAFASCEKYLNVKSDQSLIVPEKLNDLQAILDNATFMNLGYYPALAEMATDDFALSQSSLNALGEFERMVYTWQDEPLFTQNLINVNWKNPYTPVMMMNIVLEQVETMFEEEPSRARQIKGAALFMRAFSFYQLAQVYSEPYEAGGANDGLGIPIRLSSDIEIASVRVSVKDTYEQIRSDLEIALSYLPEESNYKTRPSKLACLALLARMCLTMGDYEKALDYATQLLQRKTILLDYAQLNASANLPFSNSHDELIFYAYSMGNTIVNPARALISDDLYDLYEEEDLRKAIFFKNQGENHVFKGGYHGMGGNSFFVGLAFDEILLIRAECLVRSRQDEEAIKALYQLWEKRYEANRAPVLDNLSHVDLLNIVLRERRKELLFRGLRWSDLRRLNQDSRFAKTLRRSGEIDGQVAIWELPPNDPRYTYLIPSDVILKTGMPQTKR